METKTDIFNPLVLASNAAREGNFKQCSTYIKNIATVFFPEKGNDDPVWSNSARNAFTRSAFAMIDYYLEEERELRYKWRKKPVKLLEEELDRMWGQVTLYNTYQFFTLLAGKRVSAKTISQIGKLKSDKREIEKSLREALIKSQPDLGEPDSAEALDLRIESILNEYEAASVSESATKDDAFKISLLDGAQDIDLLTLYFNATNKLPQNSMRSLVRDADNALRSMGKAEKMLASVYGIAITGMSFFTDPTIMKLTSGRPSQNVDLTQFSFPRQFGARFTEAFLEKYGLINVTAKWSIYEDEDFTKQLEGKDYEHTDVIRTDGWAMCFIKGKIPSEVCYFKLDLISQATNSLIKTFYFKYTKAYEKTLDGRFYIKNPVTENKIIKDGTFEELIKGVKGFRRGHVTMTQNRLKTVRDTKPEPVDLPVIRQTKVSYTEQPKIGFFVTPPHLMLYAKLILILLKQLVDVNFDRSYITKQNQKPITRTCYMLDELGNLKSDGNGIEEFTTLLSIGLGLFLPCLHVMCGYHNKR